MTVYVYISFQRQTLLEAYVLIFMRVLKLEESRQAFGFLAVFCCTCYLQLGVSTRWYRLDITISEYVKVLKVCNSCESVSMDSIRLWILH